MAALRSNAVANSTAAATGAASPTSVAKSVLAGAGTVSKATSTSHGEQ